MNCIEIWVPGKPQGKGRARSGILMGKGGRVITGANGRPIITHHTPEKTRTYEGLIQSAAIDAMECIGAQRFEDEPLCIDLEIAYEITPGWPAWKQDLARIGKVRPTVKPDADNVLKAVKDALNGVVWRDDCQAVYSTMTKLYREQPGVLVVVSRFEDAYPAQLKKKPTPQHLNQPQLEI